MITSCSTTPLEEIRKDNSVSNAVNSDQSESSTGESLYKEDIIEDKNDKIIYNKKRNKNNGETKFINKKVKRFHFNSPNKKPKSNINNKNNIINNIYNEFKTSCSQYSKYPQFKIIEKNIKNEFYKSPIDFNRDFRNLFSKLFLSSLNDKDYDKYEKILILSRIFENLYIKFEKNSQIKTAQKLSDDLAKLKKEMAKLTRKKNIKIGNLGQAQNLEEKKEKSMESIREDIMSKISKLNVEQKKGILSILSENYVNKDCGNKMIEFNIYNLPMNQLKQLDQYINKCINNNIIINNINYTKEIQEAENDIQMDELSSSSSGLSDSDDSDSYDLE